MKKLLLEIFAMMLASMGLVYGISGITRLVLRANGNYDSELMYHVSLIAGLCGLVLFAVLLNLFILRRLKRLSVGVKEVAQGNYEVVLNDKGFDEIRTLTDDFNNMARELKSNEYLNCEFVRNVSHELKTPLGSIIGYSELLQKSESADTETKEYASIIYSEAQRTLKMGTQMLELARLNSTEHIELNDTFRVDEQIRDILLFMQKEWTDKKIDMQIDMDECEIVGNESLTYHIWQNLISNAVKFADENGVICVRLKKGETLDFSISNTGQGIDVKDRDRVFSQFFASDKTRNTQGTGLGLPIAKKIVDILNGKIWFSCAENLTTFFVAL